MHAITCVAGVATTFALNAWNGFEISAWKGYRGNPACAPSTATTCVLHSHRRSIPPGRGDRHQESYLACDTCYQHDSSRAQRRAAPQADSGDTERAYSHLYKAVHASSRSRDSRVDTDRLTERNRRGNTRADHVQKD
jgi:hypothetical protein